MKIRVIEIGGTLTKKADVDSDNLHVEEIEEKETSSFSSLKELLEFACLKDASKVAFAIAGPIIDHRVVSFMPNVKWWPKNTDLQKTIENYSSSDPESISGESRSLNINNSRQARMIPVIVFNDMEAATRGMAHLLGNPTDPFWSITWSTGLGGQYWDGKKVTSNLEIGHLEFDRSDIICSCGGKNHAEIFLGGKFIEKELLENYKNLIDQSPFEILNNAYLNNEPWAKDFYLKKAQTMNRFIKKLLSIHQAKLICFKGKVAENALSLPQIKQEILQELPDVKLILSPDPYKDTFIGAAILTKEIKN